jgi:signal transduction histidine kinase
MASIRRKILWFLVVLIVLISTIYYIASYFYLSNISRTHVQELVVVQTENIANKMFTQDKMIESAVVAIGSLMASEFDYNKAVVDKAYLQKRVDSMAGVEKEILLKLSQNAGQAIAVYDNYDVDVFQGNYGNWFVFENGSIISVANEPLGVFYPSNPQMFWYYGPRELKSGMWTEVYSDVITNVTMFSYVVPTYTSDGKFIGVTGIDMSLDNIRKFIFSSKILNTGYSFLMDKYGDFIVEPQTNINLSLLENLRQEGKLGENGVLQLGDGVLGYLVLTDGKIVATYVSNKELSIYVKNLDLLASFFVVLVSIVFLTIVFFVTKSYIYQITELGKIAKRIGSGELSVHAKVYTKDELGDLAIIFNQMSLELSSLRNSLEGQVRDRTRQLSESQRSLERRNIQATQAKTATLNILEDVEESKEKLNEAYKQLKGLDKLKNEFLSFTSHELKTPLTPILIQAQMMQEGDFGKLSEGQKKSMDMIVRNMKTLNQLIGDVLDVSVIQTANLKIFPLRTDVAQIIRQMVSSIEPLAKQKNIKIDLKLQHLHSVLIDVRRIGQVVSNLLSNAIKFTPEGGFITVEAKENADDVIIKVIDTGIGISQEHIKTLFQPFSQVVASYKLNQKGTGLGLAICKGIVESHKGRIGVESAVGMGSTFYFTIPRKWHFSGNK